MLDSFCGQKVSIGLSTGIEWHGKLDWDAKVEAWFLHTERCSYGINPNHVVWVRNA